MESCHNQSLKDFCSCVSLSICKFLFSRLHEVIIWIGSKCDSQKLNVLTMLNHIFFPHFIIIQTLVVGHTYIGLCKYWDI
jgi:hypothetical protein